MILKLTHFILLLTFATSPLRSFAQGSCIDVFASVLYQQRMISIMNGLSLDEPSEVMSLLRVTNEDRIPRNFKLKDESRRDLALLIQSYLYDNYAFQKWLLRLSEDVAREERTIFGKNIKLVNKTVDIHELHGIVLYQKIYPSPANLVLKKVPNFSKKALHRVLEHRAQRFSFADKAEEVFREFQTIEDARSIGVLTSLESFKDTTRIFSSFVRGHTLFLDVSFRDLPHGQYSHILQWLYIAETLQASYPQSFREQLYAFMELTISDCKISSH